jgi:arylsulfatase A-like enzyme
LPFNAPAKYWDLYEPALLPAVPNSEPPLNVDPTISLHKSGEMLGRYTGFSDARRGVSPAEARRLRHAYYACVSYVDAQIGRVLAELDRLGLSESTVVVVWGDHGWHLGEHGIWGKHTLHEVALRSPLIVRTPKMASPGIETGAFVESVDIFPTLAEVCGLKPPPGFAGVSFVRQLREPSAPGKPAVYGFWSRGQAHTVRTERYRLIHWAVPKVKNRPPVEQIELYDHQNDPNETTNIAGNEPDVVAELQRQLRASVPLLDDGS